MHAIFVVLQQPPCSRIHDDEAASPYVIITICYHHYMLASLYVITFISTQPPIAHYHRHSYTLIATHTLSSPLIHSHHHLYTLIATHTLAPPIIHTRTHTHTHVHTHIPTQTHTPTHTHTLTHTYTHPNTDAPDFVAAKSDTHEQLDGYELRSGARGRGHYRLGSHPLSPRVQVRVLGVRD